jgi:putative SOS response-associated peptidase YedK
MENWAGRKMQLVVGRCLTLPLNRCSPIIWDEQFVVRTMHMMFWRYLPPFVIDPKKFRLDTINAKGESLTNSDMWRESFLTRRCLIPADSFIEWVRVDAKTKLL